MVKLFLSHASEDKDDFVRQLAEALRKKFEVWYDEYTIRIGDSLLQKISEGLIACDYGVVVLSKHFFSKKWPKEELEGLFALEDESKKVILPIWKDVTKAEVLAYSPILASRFAAKSSAGIDAVVDQIYLATDTADRKSKLSQRQSLAERFRRLDKDVSCAIASKQKLYSSDSIQEIRQGGLAILTSFSHTIALLNGEGQVIKLIQQTEFESHQRIKFVFVQGPYNLRFRLEYDESIVCATEYTTLNMSIWKSIPQDIWKKRVGAKEPETVKLQEESFSPYFDSELNLCWKSMSSSMPSERIADYVLEQVIAQIEAASKSAG